MDEISRNIIKSTLIAADEDAHQRTYDLFIQQRIDSQKRQKIHPSSHFIDKYNTSISTKTISNMKRQFALEEGTTDLGMTSAPAPDGYCFAIRKTVLNRSMSQKQADRELRAKQKQRRADLALLARVEAAQVRKLQREKERARLAALSKEEQRKLRKEARAAAIERRRSKEIQKQAEVDAAIARLIKFAEEMNSNVP